MLRNSETAPFRSLDERLYVRPRCLRSLLWPVSLIRRVGREAEDSVLLFFSLAWTAESHLH